MTTCTCTDPKTHRIQTYPKLRITHIIVVSVIEMRCPWVANREEKDVEKTTRYWPLRWELQQRNPEYRVTQFNIIVDVLGGYSRDVRKALKEVVGDKSDTKALSIQKSVITSSLNVASHFKLLK